MNYKIVLLIFMIGITGLYLTEVEFSGDKYDYDWMIIPFFFSMAITFAGVAMMMVKFVHYERILKKQNGKKENSRAGIFTYLEKDYLESKE